MFSGNIPESITVISQEPREIHWHFDDLEDGEDSAKVVVTPAFASDAANEKTIETGRQWARGWRNRDKEPREETHPNEPFSDLQIVNLEVRNEGGRAWKVITKEGYYFDLREDVLLEAQYACGISKGGVLKGKYIWGKVGSQMKIVRVGSKLYDHLVEATRRGKLKKVGVKDLDVGFVYETKAGKSCVFLGWVHTVEFDRTYEGDYRNRTEHWTKKEIPKTGLFYEVPRWADKKKLGNDLGLAEHMAGNYFYGFHLKKSPSFVVQTGEKIEVPDDIIAKIQKWHWDRAQGYRDNYVDPSNSGLVNMQPLAEPIKVHPKYRSKVDD